MVLISAETLLPMFLLWSRLCDYFRSYELPKSVSSPFWAKPEWSMGGSVRTVTPPALTEVGLPQRVCNPVKGTLICFTLGQLGKA
jgi:hypothetical protein